MEDFDKELIKEFCSDCMSRIDQAFKYFKSGCNKIGTVMSIGGITLFGLFVGLSQFISYITNFIGNLSLEIWVWAMTKLNRKRIILDTDQAEPYLERYYLLFRDRNENYPFNIFIHKILKSNTDMYDHPWGYRTLILCGGYWEHEFTTQRGTETYKTWRGPGYTETYDAYHSHKVTLEEGTPCWTVFIPFKRQKPWGFWRITKKEINKPTTRSAAALKLTDKNNEKEEIIEYEKRWIKHDIFLDNGQDNSVTVSDESGSEKRLDDYSDEEPSEQSDIAEQNQVESDKKRD